MGRRHGGKGAGRSPSMRRRIFWNNTLGTATSASWNVTYRPWLTTFAPIFTSFSRSVVNDQCSTSFGKASVLIREHGEDATLDAAQRADAMLEKGCLDGKRLLESPGT